MATPSAAVAAPSAPKTITLQWLVEPPQGVLTGICSATNLAGPWHQECLFPASITNRWTDTNLPCAKFYRAFTQ